MSSGIVYSSTFKDPSDNDIYKYTIQCGVYVIDSSFDIKSIPCSISNMSTIGSSTNDDFWLVYPGFSIILYNTNGYTGISSVLLDNTSGSNIVNYSTGSSTNGSTLVYQSNGTTIFNANSVRSVRVYFRGSVITVPGIS
jgi:hypothetical protein